MVFGHSESARSSSALWAKPMTAPWRWGATGVVTGSPFSRWRERRTSPLLSRPRDIAQLSVPGNVQVAAPSAGRPTGIPSLARLVVATPDVAYPSGQSVLLEAMAIEKPVVVTGTMALRDYVVEGTTAVPVPPDDGDALSRAVVSLYEAPEPRCHLAVNACSAIEDRFTARTMWTTIATRLYGLI